MSTKDVFLSYGREPEVIQFVVQLKCDLESHGVGVWLDTDDIPAGSDWHGAIGRGLHRCRALVAVITNKYINSRFCSSELYTADGDRKLIFPVIYEEVDFAASDTGMGVKYVISGINWCMFRPRIDDYVASLYKLIEGLREKGISSCLSKDSSHLHDQLIQMHKSPHRIHSLSGSNLPPSLQATPSPIPMGGICPAMSLGTLHSSSPPPMYSEVFPAGCVAVGDIYGGSSSASKVQEDVFCCTKGTELLSATFEPTPTGPSAVTPPPSIQRGDPAVCNASTKAMTDCREQNGTEDNITALAGSATGNASVTGLNDTSFSNSEDGQYGPEVRERTDTGAFCHPSVAMAPLAVSVVATTGAATIAPGIVPAEPCPPIDPIGASFSAETADTANVKIDLISLIEFGMSQSLPVITSNTSSPDTSKSGPPKASNTSSPDTSNAHLPDSIIEGETQDASIKSSPDSFRGHSPDTFNRDLSVTTATASAVAISPHVSHFGFIKRPISHMIKLERHLRSKLHQRLHPETSKESAVLDGEELEKEEKEEEEEEEGEGEEEQHVTEEGVASSMENMEEPSSSLLGHRNSEPKDGTDSVSHSSPNSLLPVPLPQMHLKGLRLRLANRLLKGALLPPTQQDVRVSPELDPTNHE